MRSFNPRARAGRDEASSELPQYLRLRFQALREYSIVQQFRLLQYGYTLKGFIELLGLGRELANVLQATREAFFMALQILCDGRLRRSA